MRGPGLQIAGIAPKRPWPQEPWKSTGLDCGSRATRSAARDIVARNLHGCSVTGFYSRPIQRSSPSVSHGT